MEKNQFNEASVVFNDGILHITYKEGVVLDEHIFARQIAFRKALFGDQSVFMLLDMSKASDITEGGLAFAAENPNPENVKAIGVITRKGQDHIRAKLYTVFDNPNIATKAFLSADDAKEWFLGLDGKHITKAA